MALNFFKTEKATPAQIDGTLYSLHSNMRRLREDGPRQGQDFAVEAAKINERITEAEQGVDPAIAKASRAAAYAGKREANSKGGYAKKKMAKGGYATKKMAKGGYANCGASVPGTQRSK